MKRSLIYLFVLFSTFVLSSLPVFAEAEDLAPAINITSKAKDTTGPAAWVLKGVRDAGSPAGFHAVGLNIVVANIIQVLLGVVGIIFLIVIIYAGILYLTSNGAEDKVKTAKKMMVQAIIGLILIVGAYAISNFVLTQLGQVFK